MTTRICIGVAIAIAGVVFAAVRLWPGRPLSGSAALTPEQQAEAAEAQARFDESRLRLESAFDEPAVRQERHGPESEIEDALRSVARPDRMSASHLGALVESVLPRLLLLCRPDAQEYARHVREIGGRDITRDAERLRRFEELAAVYAQGEYAWEHVEIRETIADPMEAMLTYGRRMASMTDSDLYATDRGMTGTPWDVVVPVRMTNPRNGEHVHLRLIIAMQRTVDGRWVPVKVTIADPGDAMAVLPTPWI